MAATVSGDDFQVDINFSVPLTPKNILPILVISFFSKEHFKKLFQSEKMITI